ncbi:MULTISPECIES: iron chelate uptake ABC transporter family permease subunit [unclassified Arthrobacter]|uniref:FecCD family ABC transporter permease n=1 Tax=unclassified Arthrobacter TaxID=235627 RepID=UPI001CFFF102|nr:MULTISPECIES: iron chelate uptake ABC transporter family permease subunit [unclassified Arthrobacter]MCB5281475.1 putative siderophore transport system permease protein YfiZ [Arthrobacter sp. ES1]WGZ79226.1 iron chelate uptake ABC transporter family permease subunit [Arthrobacter sp. EM1]
MSPLTTTAASTAARPAPEILTAPDRTVRGPQALWLLAAVGVLVLVAAASLGIGARGLTLETVWQAMTQSDPASGDHAVVLARVPRTALGLLAGSALGLAGAAMQGVARNPLADPGILGINAGAALAVVTGIYVFGVSSLAGYIWFAFLGAAGAAVMVYLIAALGRGGATPVKLALAGAALSAGLFSLMNVILVSSRDTLDRFRFWQVGGIAGRDWSLVLTALPFLLLGAAIVLSAGRILNNLALGDDLARGLGQRVGLTRGITALGIVLLCGAATALAGPIGFVGLVIPHAVRFLTGPDYRWILPFSLVLAPALLLVADVIGRVILLPGEVPAGIMTALVGAPVFVWLVRRGKGAGL